MTYPNAATYPTKRPKSLGDSPDGRDACGVGVVADINGLPSHTTVSQALQVLTNLAHRGARNADPLTGDGAGITTQIPHNLFKTQCLQEGFSIPDPGEYSVGIVFLPSDSEVQRQCQDAFHQIVCEQGQTLLGWRRVPIDETAIGATARIRMPTIMQVFVGKSTKEEPGTSFELKLYIIRKLVEQRIASIGSEYMEDFYICSLSSTQIVYKGMLIADQVSAFYTDLQQEDFVSSFGIVHSRFSTNTLGSWKLAHPYRHVVHNGEINTLRGNMNWMTARQGLLASSAFDGELANLFPIITPDASDTAAFDNVLELLLRSGRSLAHSLSMMIPEAWEKHPQMTQEKRDYYEYHACLMEPWDGPALIVATDGNQIAAILDRNGLRPFRYTVTHDGLLVMGSETGALELDPSTIKYRGRLSPGKMFLVDPNQGKIIDDDELKADLSKNRPYGDWLADNRTLLESLPKPREVYKPDFTSLIARQRAFGFTEEDVNQIVTPMANNGIEPIGSMGLDTPLAVLSDRPQMLFNYFKQLFAQVTNPPLDAIREELVTSLDTYVGAEQNLLTDTPEHCRRIKLKSPILTNHQIASLKELDEPGLTSKTISATVKIQEGKATLAKAMDSICKEASLAVNQGHTLLIISDQGVDRDHMRIPILLVVAGIHHHLIREGLRMKTSLIAETGEVRDVHQYATLLGYGAAAINPYLALETIEDLCRQEDIISDPQNATASYIKAVQKGILKIMSKMGISTLASYRGAQIFEAVGLHEDLIDEYFTWTSSRIGGIDIEHIQKECLQHHRDAFPMRRSIDNASLSPGGFFQWYRDGEHHMLSPTSIALLQEAASQNRQDSYNKFADLCDSEDRHHSTIRGLLQFDCLATPIPLEEVETETEIVKRFSTGGISLGAISKEAHETLAIAMNSMGARSNTGEGGEDHRRFEADSDGKWRNSAMKQVASGRFGVTAHYLANASDIQIKMAQGSKPGEGGQLPGGKIDEYIGWIRGSTPGVELISPPPHHDIYSIEDLAQLIHDLKNVNPLARINVKLVSEVGVGTIAAGVAKAFADVVLISGDSGGTGASPWSSIKNAGLPWELGVAEAHQVLVENDLRSRIVVQTDGQLKTGRDVAIACMLGAEEFGFSTVPLITLGCIMLRKCHLNTCSVGVATQDPVLRARFAGKPEAVVNYFFMVARQVRELMASLGFRTMNEMVGRADKLKPRENVDFWKAKQLDLSRLLHVVEAPASVGRYKQIEQDHGIENALDNQIISATDRALKDGEQVTLNLDIKTHNRCALTMLSGTIAKQFGKEGLPPNTITINFTGSAGQSFGAFLAEGISASVTGDANDYFGKGMGGGRLVLKPSTSATFLPEDNIAVGNVVLYGATGGKLFVRGRAGERFAVRNSGAKAVVEGIGDHGCEYMTGGVVVVLGPTGRNFAAGMSGGTAYIYDNSGNFADFCNHEMVDLDPICDDDEIQVRALLVEHEHHTDSELAARILSDWPTSLPKFVKVAPREYKRVLAERAARTEDETADAMELIKNG